jgi:hypothetical protein
VGAHEVTAGIGHGEPEDAAGAAARGRRHDANRARGRGARLKRRGWRSSAWRGSVGPGGGSGAGG